MDQHIAIQKLSEQLKLTSRTLRHWESEGLIKSSRDPVSGWRSYDSRGVFCIKLTALLRSYDISLKDIKKVLDSGSMKTLRLVISQYLHMLEDQKLFNESAEKSLKALLSAVSSLQDKYFWAEDLDQMLSAMQQAEFADCKKEDQPIMNANTANLHVRFITLPPMRAACCTVVSESPEDEAQKAVLQWLKEKNLLGTARIFGRNMPPMPSGEGKPYGYGVLASIPEGIAIPAPLQEMTVPGGLYAVFESSDDIGASWDRFMQYLSGHEEYTQDSSRPCFEEHIRNDAPEGIGPNYFLHLLEPVKRK